MYGETVCPHTRSARGEVDVVSGRHGDFPSSLSPTRTPTEVLSLVPSFPLLGRSLGLRVCLALPGVVCPSGIGSFSRELSTPFVRVFFLPWVDFRVSSDPSPDPEVRGSGPKVGRTGGGNQGSTRLVRSLESGRPLVVDPSLDPTRPIIHCGVAGETKELVPGNRREVHVHPESL